MRTSWFQQDSTNTQILWPHKSYRSVFNDSSSIWKTFTALSNGTQIIQCLNFQFLLNFRNPTRFEDFRSVFCRVLHFNFVKSLILNTQRITNPFRSVHKCPFNLVYRGHESRSKIQPCSVLNMASSAVGFHVICRYISHLYSSFFVALDVLEPDVISGCAMRIN